VTTALDPDRLAQRKQQIQQAEELLAGVPERLGLGKGLFWGRLVANWVFPYPRISDAEQERVNRAIAELTQFCDQHLDPERIDREAQIPREVIDGLAELGVLGMTAPREFGGQGFSQLAYGKILEIIGARCSSTAIFVNAHHSIGMRALLLFGTPEQQKRWLPDLVSGRKLAAFALTEPEAGSDAANVQTLAVLNEAGTHYVLNGQKRYITNGAIADVLTVMARTPIPGKSGTAVTAFLVTPDLPGFRVVEPRMEKLGIRGTATARLAFEQMQVPRENVLGPLGKGLKVALTVLDFGRTTFGACCTGAAKTSLKLALQHAHSRKQFGRTLGEFELTQQRLARMAAWTYAMEAMTSVTAGLIDRGLEDYMLETAMLKVYSTERLWTIVNDTFQLYGGAAYFTDKPLERMLRDHRINQIGEGANEVLLSFIALSGMRGPGLRLKDVWESLQRPWNGLTRLWEFAHDRALARVTLPDVPVQSPSLSAQGQRFARLLRRFGTAVERTLMRHREEVVERQMDQERISWGAMELFASACVLSRRESELLSGDRDANTDALVDLFLTMSLDNVETQLGRLQSDTDGLYRTAASRLLRAGSKVSER
jgi:alkylation response protein AidB-like acyl-CoA dehydrogenase